MTISSWASGVNSRDRLRLGLIGPLPPPNGGMAMQTLQLARLLAEEGLSVEVLQTNAPYKPAVVGRLRGVRAVFRLLPYVWRVWRLAGRADVIHLMANSGWSWQLFAAPVLWLASFRGTPVIVNYRGGEAREYLAASQRNIRPSLQRAACLVVPSGFLREVFNDYAFSARVIPNIVDLNTFSPGEADTAGRSFTLAITRNLESIYGLDTALQALAIAREQAPDMRLEIAGSGPELADLQSMAGQLGISDAVTFLGRLEREQVVDLYHRSQAMLNPTRVDNMPNSVLEGMACALAVISTNVGGVPFIVEHRETGLLVPPDDPAAMACAMLELYRDQGLRDALGARAREAVAGYDWTHVRNEWLSVYDQYGVAS